MAELQRLKAPSLHQHSITRTPQRPKATTALPQKHLQHHMGAPSWAGTDGKRPLAPKLSHWLFDLGTEWMDMKMGQSSGRDTPTQGRLELSQETPQRPQTCHL